MCSPSMIGFPPCPHENDEDWKKLYDEVRDLVKEALELIDKLVASEPKMCGEFCTDCGNSHEWKCGKKKIHDTWHVNLQTAVNSAKYISFYEEHERAAWEAYLAEVEAAFSL